MPRLPLLLALAALLFLAPVALSGQDTKVEEMLAEAEELRSQSEHRRAISLYRRADKASGEGSIGARIGLAQAYEAVGAYRDQVKTAQSLLDLELTPVMEAYAHTLIGTGLVSQAGDDLTEKHLVEAEASFRRALEIAGDRAPANFYFNLGDTLLKQGRDEDGIAVLEQMLALADTGGLDRRAESLIERPERARRTLVPAFAVSTMEGEYVSDLDLEGKVVVFDFWGSWCAPCRESTSTLVRLHQRFTKDDQPFVLLGVNTDSSEEAARAYMEDHGIEWDQIYDESRRFSYDTFGVRSYPTFMVFAPDGELVYRGSGWSDRIGAELSGAVRRAVRKAEKGKS